MPGRQPHSRRRCTSHTVNGGPDQLGVNFRAYRWNTLSLDDASNDVLHLVFAGTNGISYRTLWSSNLASARHARSIVSWTASSAS